jgi:hypothetical protein
VADGVGSIACSWFAFCTAAPKISLVGGAGPSNGRVEISMDGSIYTVCSDIYWSDYNADATCRMLGYGGGQAVLVRFHALQDILVADSFNSR